MPLSTISKNLKLSCKKGENGDESCHSNLNSPSLPLDTAEIRNTLWSCIFYAEVEAEAKSGLRTKLEP